jgi:hypothetical protein
MARKLDDVARHGNLSFATLPQILCFYCVYFKLFQFAGQLFTTEKHEKNSDVLYCLKEQCHEIFDFWFFS